MDPSAFQASLRMVLWALAASEETKSTDDSPLGVLPPRVVVTVGVDRDVLIDVLLEYVVAWQSSTLVLGRLSQGPVRSVGIRNTGKHEEVRVHDLIPYTAGRLKGQSQTHQAPFRELAHVLDVRRHRDLGANVRCETPAPPPPQGGRGGYFYKGMSYRD